MKFSPETLMAYADDELDAETRRTVEAAMATDPQIAQEIERHRALRGELHNAFGGVLDEPIPERLIEAAKTAGGSGRVSDLAARRAAKAAGAERRRWSWPEWTSIAASLVIGVLAGRSVLREPEVAANPESMIAATKDGRVIAAGELAAALTERSGGSVDEDADIQIGVSFRAKSGQYCRTFSTGEENAVAGFACRDADAWRVQALAQTHHDATDNDYRMASTELPAPIVQAVADEMVGDALDAGEEAAARARGWQSAGEQKTDRK